MCGISGYLASDSSRPVALEAMTVSMRRRGPDRAAAVRVGPGGLGVTRLAIVGGDQGAQPRFDADRRSAFAMNGEIYNWCDLAGSLGLDTNSDSVATHAWLDRRGRSGLEQLRGAYSLAWLTEGGRRLLLASDQFGQRPLYFAEHGGVFLFASEIRALLRAGVAAVPDEPGLADFLTLQFYRPGRTAFRGISRLEPGEWLEVRVGARGPEVTRGRFSFTARPVAGLAGAFAESVRLQGRRDVPAALFLSGGLDSTAVASGLARAGRPPEAAWVGWFPEAPSEWDERPHARIAATAAGLELRELAITGDAWVAALAETVTALEEPLAGPGSVSQLLLGRAAAPEARVVYGGQGGDELFGGYERIRLLQVLEQGGRRSPDPAYAPLFERMLAARDLSPADALAPWRAALDRTAEIAPVLDGRARELLREREPDELVPGVGESPADAATRWERDVLLPGLLHVDDRVTAWWGLESRAPLLDPCFAAAALAVPMAAKSPPEAPRRLFRRELAAYLPPAIAARTDKRGFPVPFGPWLRGPLGSFAQDVFHSRASRERGFVAPDAWERHRGALAGRGVFALLMLELWHRAFCDRPAGAGEDGAAAAILDEARRFEVPEEGDAEAHAVAEGVQ